MVEAMEIQEGFKQTEVGVIPSDWKLKLLEEILKVRHGKSQKEVTDANGKYPILASGGVIGKANKYLYNKPSVLIGRKGTIDKPQFMSSPFWSVDTLFYTEIFENSSPKFIFYNFLIIDWYSYNEASGVPSLNAKTIEQIKIPLPPTKAEQTAIATALSDADALITQLEKLIDKKRNIKQGAMQELLTGKKKLSGFTDEWILNPFPDVCWFQEGPGLRNWQFTKSGMKVINVTNLENGYLNLERTDRHISIEEFNRMYKHFAIDENDIVVASSGNSYAKVAIVRKQDLPLVMNTSVIRFKPLKQLDYDFLLAFLKSYLFKDQIDLLITGGAQPNFGPVHLKKIVIKMPPTIGEQKAIAGILTNMDLEIFGLEKKLEKYKQIKQGMMQNLLTGKIRLI
jgi:type I restriction enzyme S subunit